LNTHARNGISKTQVKIIGSKLKVNVWSKTYTIIYEDKIENVDTLLVQINNLLVVRCEYENNCMYV